MGIQFNADEIFAIAERMEENAAAFYRRAAELHGSGASGQVDFLLRLADMEDEHKRTFSQMRGELTARETEGTAADPDREAGLYLDEMADTRGGEGAPRITASLNGDESMEDILRMAIDLEGKAIVFYVGIKNSVPAKLGKERLDNIIAQEKDHVVTLTDELRKLKGAAS